MSAKTYTCEKCGKSVEEFIGPLARFDNPRIFETDFPEYHLDDPTMGDFFRELDAANGRPAEPVKKYHLVHVWTKGYGCRCCGGLKPTLCGPLHEESEHERYVRFLEDR